MHQTKGAERERSLAKAVYFDRGYFVLPQLFSLSHQINGIHQMQPASLLEIGIGNGFVSDFFRKSGLPVITADINPALEPDIVAPIHELPAQMNGRRVDVVACCEVLEHMPFEQFPKSLEILRSLGDRLFLTLPNNRKSFGLGGLWRMPKVKEIPVSLAIDFPSRKALPPEHFWEVGYSPETSNGAIVRELRKHYGTVVSGRFALNRYHRFYIAS